MSRYTDACRSVGGVSDWLDMDPTPKVNAEVADLKSKIASIDPFMKGPTIPADVALQWKSYNDRANQFISHYDGEWIKNHPGDTTALNSLIADFEPFRKYYNDHAKAQGIGEVNTDPTKDEPWPWYVKAGLAAGVLAAVISVANRR